MSDSVESRDKNQREDMMDVELVLGAGSDYPVRLTVTRARVVDRDDGVLEIGLPDEDMEEYHAELRLDEGSDE